MTPEEVNKKIAEWLGWLPNDSACNEWWTGTELVDSPSFFHSNAAAIELLNVLVEKGYWIDLGVCTEGASCQIGKQPGQEDYCSLLKPTISEAICTAIIALIEKEEANER